MSAHAQLSPSSWSRWSKCPGSVALCRDLPDTSGPAANEGSDAHELAERCLTTNTDTVEYLGQAMKYGTVVDTEMVGYVQQYVNYVRELAENVPGAQLLVEQRLPIGHLTGEEDARGTSDVVILADDEIIVVDLKYGRGVPVSAEGNGQLQIYALAALKEFEAVIEPKRVRMVIHQPRLNSVTEWVQPLEDMLAFKDAVKRAAAAVELADAPLVPGNSQCKFCKAKATCRALADEALNLFEVIKPEAPEDMLALAMSKADMVESWLKAVRAEVERRLLAGTSVPGFKLVQGKRGNRQWVSTEEAEAMLKTMRVKHDQMYEYKVISPTTAEKLAKADVIGARQWPKLQGLITQPEGKPSVAPATDKRPALDLAISVDSFSDLSQPVHQE